MLWVHFCIRLVLNQIDITVVCANSYTIKLPILTTYRSCPPLLQLAFHITEIETTIYFLYFGKFFKSVTSHNGPLQFTRVKVYIEVTLSGRSQSETCWIWVCTQYEKSLASNLGDMCWDKSFVWPGYAGGKLSLWWSMYWNSFLYPLCWSQGTCICNMHTLATCQL